jgi:hypothetical protein
VSDHGLTGLSRLTSNWLQYHYIPALAATCVLLAIATAFASKYFVEPAARSIPLPPQAPLPAALRGGLLALMVLGLGCYAWLMIAWEEFTFYDAHIFFQSLAGGPQYALLQLFPTLGRAYPLTHQEFYPLSFIGNSAAVYQVFSFLEMLLGGFLLTRLLRESLAITVLVCIAILLAPPIVAALFHIVNSERNILLLLCIFLWSALAYEKTGRAAYVVLAAVASFLSLQYKETAAVMMTAWGGYLLLAAWLGRTRSQPGRRALAMIGGSVLVGCAIWFIVFAIAVLPQVERSYVVGRSHDPLLVLQVLGSQVWFLVLLGAIACRLLLARRGLHVSPLWDGAALGALAFTAAYVKLGFIHEYYYSPAALLAWLYAGRLGELALANSGQTRRAALTGFVALLAPLALFQSLNSFWWVYTPWKENVASKADAAKFIDALHAARSADQRRQPMGILFPRSSNYEAAFFIGYLEARYRTLDVAVQIGGPGRDRLAGETSQCVLWVPVMCSYGLSGKSGDVAVYFGEEGDDVAALKADYHLIHVSPEIGFWPNRLHAYVFAVP